eukprot:2492138-Amphidinium_carterae.1
MAVRTHTPVRPTQVIDDVSLSTTGTCEQVVMGLTRVGQVRLQGLREAHLPVNQNRSVVVSSCKTINRAVARALELLETWPCT